MLGDRSLIVGQPLDEALHSQGLVSFRASVPSFRRPGPGRVQGACWSRGSQHLLAGTRPEVSQDGGKDADSSLRNVIDPVGFGAGLAVFVPVSLFTSLAQVPMLSA